MEVQGWILEGWPRTADDASKLVEAGLGPQVVIGFRHAILRFQILFPRLWLRLALPCGH